MSSKINIAEPGRFHIPDLLREVNAVIAFIVDEQGYLSDANRGFLHLTGQPNSEEQNRNITDLFVNPAFSDLINARIEAVEQPVYRGILNIGNPNQFFQSVTGSVFRFQNELLVIAEYDIKDLERLTSTVLELNNKLTQTQRDLVKANQQLKRNEKKITHLMLIDSLTNIANRRHFEQRIKEEILLHMRNKQSLSLAIGDIDFFKRVNDSYGHDVGDMVICSFSDTLRDNIRAGDFIARIGGEEFIVLFPQTTHNEAYQIINRIRELFVNKSYAGISHAISASFGISSLQQNDNPDSFLKRADKGLYKAKETGRNKVIVQL